MERFSPTYIKNTVFLVLANPNWQSVMRGELLSNHKVYLLEIF